MVDVTQDFGLSTVAFGPMPFLLQLVRERIGVFQTFDVAAASRIAVPVPGPANSIAGLEGAQLETELTQAVDRVETADASTHDDRIKSAYVYRRFRHFKAPCEVLISN